MFIVILSIFAILFPQWLSFNAFMQDSGMEFQKPVYRAVGSLLFEMERIRSAYRIFVSAFPHNIQGHASFGGIFLEDSFTI